ncbi:MAG: nucleotidyltransferase domain-containing protein [Chloroflexota bacterium]|nr:nucleotidyltransferase domain-containing protein [Chloroflexota bacterium]
MIADPHARRVIDDIVTRLKKEYRPEKIILFGSYAYGKPTRDSDIDLFVIKDTVESPFERRITVRRICHMPKHHIPFQPLVVTPSEWAERLEMGDPFFREIQSKGETLYAARREGITTSKRLVRQSRAGYEARGRPARNQRRRRSRVSSAASR